MVLALNSSVAAGEDCCYCLLFPCIPTAPVQLGVAWGSCSVQIYRVLNKESMLQQLDCECDCICPLIHRLAGLLWLYSCFPTSFSPEIRRESHFAGAHCMSVFCPMPAVRGTDPRLETDNAPF